MTRTVIHDNGEMRVVEIRNDLGVVIGYDETDLRQQPLDPTGALATLLAVTGTLTVEDAANAVGLPPEALVLEAEAWAAAAAQ